MKTLDIDEYLKSTGVKIVIKGKEYVVKDFPKDFDDEESNDLLVSKIIGCPVEDLADYGSAALLKIYDFLHENLIPKNFQTPLLDDSKKRGR
ncbi:MAG: hypothetical protein KAU20_05920 [Nanoarchaeota archaeon]|nr:hypothetical protein [Nanoarchaeota archaeon]